mmetsp:Transcript_6663/g.11639  ORF Transcript_6663/g.11639 Transcript_6663/m.11639 type:complete len:87 (+) Transcript_6663:1105-1365(+)
MKVLAKLCASYMSIMSSLPRLPVKQLTYYSFTQQNKYISTKLNGLCNGIKKKKNTVLDVVLLLLFGVLFVGLIAQKLFVGAVACGE